MSKLLISDKPTILKFVKKQEKVTDLDSLSHTVLLNFSLDSDKALLTKLMFIHLVS